MTPIAATSPADGEFARARRQLITRRLPLFAVGWLGLGLVLRTGLLVRGELAVGPAVVSLAMQFFVLSWAILACRADPEHPRVIGVTVATCVLLVVFAAVFFARLGGSVEALAFAFGTISVGSSMAFAWGWRPALVVAAVALATGLLTMPVLHRLVDPIELVLEVVIGDAIAITVAEASARAFRRSFEQERARSESARRLAASHAAYRDLAENARDLIFTHDLDGRITYVNEAFARCYDVPAAALIGRDGTTLIPQDPTNPDAATIRARIAAGEEIPPLIYWVRAPEGRRWLECVMSAIHDVDGRVVGVRGITRDVTERHTAEEALRASLEELRGSEERLRRLASHQATIREDERKRLGFDLHDDVCQELVGIGILVEAARRRVAESAPDLGAELARISGYVNEVGEHLRQMARDLRPMMLRELGLEESLHSLAEGMRAAGTPVFATFATTIPRLDEETEIGVYRIAQEALANAVRHAGARAIQVTLAIESGSLAIERSSLALDGTTLALAVVDDGRGFRPEEQRGGESLGLIGMEERALALGGRLEVRSAPGAGTTIRLVCPIAVRAPASAA